MKWLERITVTIIIALLLTWAGIIITAEGGLEREPVPPGFSRFAR
jgi:hypothetical protein